MLSILKLYIKDTDYSIISLVRSINWSNYSRLIIIASRVSIDISSGNINIKHKILVKIE